MSEAQDREFDSLLDYLKRTRGFDFSAYKRPSLMRRVQKRMQSVNIERFGDYSDYLEVHPEEFAQLFNVILINVTSFFRDEQAWDYVRDKVLPEVVSARPEEPVRVWSAGCASGEETYSLAMLLAEALGRDGFRDRVKIYATDADEQALNQARAAAYTETQLTGVPRNLIDKYFTQDSDRFVFDKDLRRSVIFGRHDLVQDAPISRVSLLVCRNTLMYFNTEAQSRILARFHFALAEHGILFLGKAEMLLTHAQLFAPVDLRRRIFRKILKDNWRERLAIMNQASGEEMVNGGNNHTLYPAVLDASPHAQFAIDANGLLAMFNERARVLFGLVPGDLGRPIQDLELSYRPIEVRSLVAQVVEQRRPVTLREAVWEAVGREARYFDVYITALNDNDGRVLGVSVSYVDVTRIQELQNQLNRSKQDLETAYEELQSTNEELHTVNEEYRERSEALNQANGFLESVLTGVRSGVVVLDRELRIVAWNHRAEDLWGLRDEEVKGQKFLNLDIGLPTEQLRTSIRSCLNGDRDHVESTLQATTRRGKSIACKVIATPLLTATKEIHGCILLMEEYENARVMS